MTIASLRFPADTLETVTAKDPEAIAFALTKYEPAVQAEP